MKLTYVKIKTETCTVCKIMHSEIALYLVDLCGVSKNSPVLRSSLDPTYKPAPIWAP